jgi:hypothetical protein
MAMKESRRAVRDRHIEAPWSALLRQPKIYRRIFERVLCIRSPSARALRGLGPAFHFSQALFGGAAQALVVGIVSYGIAKVAFPPMRGDNVVQLQTVLPMFSYMAFYFAIQLSDSHLRALCHGRKEQALLVLLPGVPNGRALNQSMMVFLLTQHVTAIACALGVVTAITLALNDSMEAALRVSVPAFGASLLAAPGVLRDYARLKPPGLMQSGVPMILFGVPLQTIVLFKPLDISPAALVLVAFGVSAALTLERYRRFSEAPPAFPVGRLAA